MDHLTTLDSLSCDTIVCFTPADAETDFKEWLGPERTYFPQEGGDLGERMSNAFRQAFCRGYQRVILIGSDSPDLSAAILDEALDSLDDNDAVIGPSRDGGYYLIGFRDDSFKPEVFEGIEWSMETVLETTLRNLENNWDQVHMLQEWNDIDTMEDVMGLYQRSKQGKGEGEGECERTMRFIKETRILNE